MDKSIQLLMLAVVQEQDMDTATRALSQLDLPVVYLSSAGGFLGRRNATLLIGLRAGKEEAALKALEDSCRQRIEYLTLPLEGSPLPMPTPVPVTVGGATVLDYLSNTLKNSKKQPPAGSTLAAAKQECTP